MDTLKDEGQKETEVLKGFTTKSKKDENKIEASYYWKKQAEIIQLQNFRL